MPKKPKKPREIILMGKTPSGIMAGYPIAILSSKAGFADIDDMVARFGEKAGADIDQILRDQRKKDATIEDAS